MAMDMEQRVKTLEQEMKVLKNQIQKTLLDIQEQVLLQYHPALRAEDGPVMENEPVVSPVKVIRLSPENDFQAAESQAVNMPVPQAATTAAPVPAAISAPAAIPTPAATPSTEARFEELANWVGDCVGKIGVARTRKLLELRAATGSVPPHVYDMLQQIITLYEADEGLEVTETAVLFQQLNHLLTTEH